MTFHSWRVPVRPVWITSLVLIIASSSFILQRYQNYGLGQYYLNALQKPLTELSNAADFALQPAQRRAIPEYSNQLIRESNPLPTIANPGRTDLYPNEVAILHAYGFDYFPRPVIQSFSAYTADLAKLNAAHLESAQAPDTVLFNIDPIEDRLASSEDGFSWPQLLTYYDLTNADNVSEYLVLKRRSTPRNYKLLPLDTLTIEPGQWVDISQWQGPIWLQFQDAAPSLWGKLATSLLRLPNLTIEVETTQGNLWEYTLLMDVFNAGGLISPVLNNRLDFALFAASPSSADLAKTAQVKRFRLKTEQKWAYRSAYTARLSQLDFERQADINLGELAVLRESILLDATVTSPDHARLEFFRGPEGIPALQAHAETRIAAVLPEQAAILEIGFGLRDGSWQDSNATDGVEFRVSAAAADGAETVLLQRRLDPLDRPSDRGTQSAQIDLSAVNAQTIILETLPGEHSQWDWSYWSKAKISDKEQ